MTPFLIMFWGKPYNVFWVEFVVQLFLEKMNFYKNLSVVSFYF